ncbi:MAG: OmpH family outer membrane protein [Sedimentisphaerales bacterium]|nr:OmpH family outer membrane protein [Sedimentisphaerales bacterium]
MKYKMIALVVCAAIMVTAIIAPGAEKTPATQDGKCLKIGVCSVRKIFQGCKRNAAYRQQMSAESDRMEAEMKKLSAEIDLDKQGLRSLKTGTADYSQAMKEILEKQGRLQAQQEYFKRVMEMRENQMIENLFKDVIKATAEVAKEKGLDLVLERSEPELPAGGSTELTLTISTHKVLYNAGCDDITDAVLAKVDATETVNPAARGE